MKTRAAVAPNHRLAALTALATQAMLAGQAVLAVLLLGTLENAVAQPRGTPTTPSDQGWTAVNRPADVIAGRKALMQEAGLLMAPIDVLAVTEAADAQPVADLQRGAESIERLLLAFPHLFPPSTNPSDESDALEATAALPEIWLDFSAFYAANEAAIRAAQALAAATGAEQRAAAAVLRGRCDGCHAAYMQAYVPPALTDADIDLDLEFEF